MTKLTKRELIFISKLVDEQRDCISQRLIHMEALNNKRLNKIHKTYYAAYEEARALADKLDSMIEAKR